MGRRITDVTSAEFDALFTGFRHTAFRLETLQAYDVSYEIEPYNAFLAGQPRPQDSAKNAWTAMLAEASTSGKVVQRVHLVNEPLTDYLRYEMEWSYPPNIEAGEDIRILPVDITPADEVAALSVLEDYWLFDSRDLWAMRYDRDGKFIYIEQVSDPSQVVMRAYWRDAALHRAVPYADYVRRAEMSAAS
jgi:hypothetical protein